MGVCLDDRWTGILVLGKREGEVLGGCARLLQVHSASRVCVAPCRLRGQVCTPRVAAGLGLQINTDNQKQIVEEITNGEIMLSPEPAEETRVRSRHGSPRGVCAAAAWA